MNARLILTTSCLLLLLAHTEAADWEKLPPLPAPNGGFVVAVDHGKVVVAGGTNWEGGKKNWLTKVWAFDPQTLKWEALADLAQPVAYAVGGTHHDSMVFGGGSSAEGALPFVQLLEKDGFTAHKADLPPSVVLAAGGVFQNALIFSGGTPDASQIAKASKATWSIDLETRQITSHAPCPGPPFLTAASAMDSTGRLFVFGGGTWDEKAQAVANLSAAYAFDVKKNSWQARHPLPYAVRGLTGASIGSQFIYLVGGYKNDAEGFTDEALLYDITKDEYRPAKRLPYKAMVALVVCDDYLYCLGGEDKKQSRTDACFRIAVADLLK
jgi:N-acetylneuraminic acid mutarotase